MTSRLLSRRAAMFGMSGAAVLAAAGAVWSARPGVDTTPAPTPSATYSLTPQQALAAAEPPAAPDAPAMTVTAMDPDTIWIPSLGAYGPLVDGDLVDRSLELPDDPKRMTLWAGGAAPGADAGTTLISGHVSYRGTSGTLKHLARIAPGARIYIKDDTGVVTQWVTTAIGSIEVQKTALPDWVWAGPTGDRRLVLVTCGGPLIPGTTRHRDNVIVTAVPVPGSVA